MSEVRTINEIPVHILQEIIAILRTNEKFIGEGKVKDYYILKTEKFATVIYDNKKVSFISNFVKDEQNNWFFSKNIIVRNSLQAGITDSVLREFGLIEKQEKEE